MGLGPFSFADALLGVLAQRLARGLCKQCREPYPASAQQYDELAQAYGPEAFHELAQRQDGSELRRWRAVGCNACNRSGYKGRVAIHELLVSDGELKSAIQRKAPVGDIRKLAVASGMTTLPQDGIEKILAGHTDQEQVLAVCGGPH